MNSELLTSAVVDYKQLLLLKSKQLNIKDDECHILLIIMMMKDSGIKNINPKTISNYSSLKLDKIDNILLSLLNKHYIDRKNGISLLPIYKILLEINVDDHQELNLIESFEEAFGRTLSSNELTIIDSFKTSGNSDERILDALNEAVKSNVFNFRYIEKILDNWQKNGVKKRFAQVPKSSNHQVSDEIKNYDWVNKHE